MSLHLKPMMTAEAEIGTEHYQTVIRSADHMLFADEPASQQGTDTGMSPYSLLLASLGSCTAITLRMYADRKAWPVEHILVKLAMYKQPTGTLIERKIEFKGVLADDQLSRLIAIANSCPVHQLLTHTIDIQTTLV